MDTDSSEISSLFPTDTGGGFTGCAFVDLCDSLGIRCEYTAPHKTQKNEVVEVAIWRAMQGGYAARLEAEPLLPAADMQ